MRINKLKHKFVENMPSSLDAEILYIAPDYATMMHLCCCGCGNEVVTPLSRNDWRFVFDGESVTVHPSIGSWSLQCKSHYIIKDGMIRWSNQWTDAQIRAGRDKDLKAKRGSLVSQKATTAPEQKAALKRSLFRRLIEKLFS